MGEGVWKTSDIWPPTGISLQRWYLGPDGSLTTATPTDEAGVDEYTVDFTATTGDATRWHTQLGGSDVVYPDRAAEDNKLLTYTSEPMNADVEITGSPVITLYVSSTETDGAFHVYLEDVAPDGRVTYLTEGILRAIHRSVSGALPPYTMLGPYHSFLRGDGAPLTPGEVATVPVQLYATSVLIRQGHRIRVSIAGHDASMFLRYPAEGIPVLTIQRNTVHASYIDLPMLERP
jgi:putative CocE/NonD family hydrolase